MYELYYVKRRKRRVKAAIIGGIGATGVATFCIAAFLGHQSGAFTVSLEAKDIQLTLSEKSDFVNSSSFLRVKEIPAYHEYTYRNFYQEYSDEILDSEDQDYTLGLKLDRNHKATNFLKYTFFLKNVGIEPAKFDLSLRINDVVADVQGRTLVDTFRVMVYENGVPTVYGNRLQNPHLEENGPDYRAPISVDKTDASTAYPFEGYAEMFVSSSEIMNQLNQDIAVGEVRKYTFVVWLEGFRTSSYTLAPEGASIKLGVEINAYENE